MGKYDALFEDEGTSNKYAALLDEDADGHAETPDEAAQREAFLKPGGTKAYKNRREYPSTKGDAEALANIHIPGNAESAVRGVATVGNSIIDAASLGGYRTLLRMGGLESAARDVEQYREDLPIVSGLSDAPGYFVGPAAMLAKSIHAGLGGVARAAPPAVGKVIGSRPVTGALTGAGTGGGVSAAQEAASGGDLGDVAKAGGKGALIGAALGGGMGTVAAGASKARQMLRDPRGEMGRSIQALETAKASGITEDPAFKALKHGAPGANQAAQTAEASIAARNEAFVKAESQHYQAEQARILAKNGDRYHYIPDAEAALAEAAEANTINGVVGDENLAAAIDKTRRMLTVKAGIDSRATAAAQEANPNAGAVYIDAPAVKVTDLVKTKRIVDSLAQYGHPPTPENVPYRKISSVLGKELEGIDPEMAALNQRYHAAMSKAEETNLLMYGEDASRIMKTPAQQRQASGMLGRIGDETQAATLREPQVARLKELDPGNAQDISVVEAKKAIERTRYGRPKVSRRIEHMPYGFVEQNASALGARVVDPLLGQLSSKANSPEAIAAGLGIYRAVDPNDRRRRK